MKFRKLVSALSAFAIVVSAFVGFSIPANAATVTRTLLTDDCSSTSNWVSSTSTDGIINADRNRYTTLSVETDGSNKFYTNSTSAKGGYLYSLKDALGIDNNGDSRYDNYKITFDMAYWSRGGQGRYAELNTYDSSGQIITRTILGGYKNTSGSVQKYAYLSNGLTWMGGSSGNASNYPKADGTASSNNGGSDSFSDTPSYWYSCEIAVATDSNDDRTLTWSIVSKTDNTKIPVSVSNVSYDSASYGDISYIALKYGYNIAYLWIDNISVTCEEDLVATSINLTRTDSEQDYVYVGNTAEYSAAVYDQDGGVFSDSVTWSVSGDNGASSINSSGVLTVGSNTADNTTLTVTATSNSDNTVIGTKTVTVRNPVADSIAISGSDIVFAGNSTTYSATMTDQYGDPFSGTVTWSVSGDAGATINSSTGELTVGSGVADNTTLTITATCGSASTTKTVTVSAAGVYLQNGTTVTNAGGSAKGNTNNIDMTSALSGFTTGVVEVNYTVTTDVDYNNTGGYRKGYITLLGTDSSSGTVYIADFHANTRKVDPTQAVYAIGDQINGDNSKATRLSTTDKTFEYDIFVDLDNNKVWGTITGENTSITIAETSLDVSAITGFTVVSTSAGGNKMTLSDVTVTNYTSQSYYFTTTQYAKATLGNGSVKYSDAYGKVDLSGIYLKSAEQTITIEKTGYQTISNHAITAPSIDEQPLTPNTGTYYTETFDYVYDNFGFTGDNTSVSLSGSDYVLSPRVPSGSTSTVFTSPLDVNGKTLTLDMNLSSRSDNNYGDLKLDGLGYTFNVRPGYGLRIYGVNSTQGGFYTKNNNNNYYINGRHIYTIKFADGKAKLYIDGLYLGEVSANTSFTGLTETVGKGSDVYSRIYSMVLSDSVEDVTMTVTNSFDTNGTAFSEGIHTYDYTSSARTLGTTNYTYLPGAVTLPMPTVYNGYTAVNFEDGNGNSYVLDGSYTLSAENNTLTAHYKSIFTEGTDLEETTTDHTATFRFLARVDYNGGDVTDLGFRLINFVGKNDTTTAEQTAPTNYAGADPGVTFKDVPITMTNGFTSGGIFYYDIKGIPFYNVLSGDTTGRPNAMGIYAVPYIVTTSSGTIWGIPFTSHTGEGELYGIKQNAGGE